jgi:hypothetical protein
MPKPKNPTELRIALANLSPREAKFLRSVIMLLTDPQYATDAENLRSGKTGLIMHPSGGAASYPLFSLENSRN